VPERSVAQSLRPLLTLKSHDPSDLDTSWDSPQPRWHSDRLDSVADFFGVPSFATHAHRGLGNLCAVVPEARAPLESSLSLPRIPTSPPTLAAALGPELAGVAGSTPFIPALQASPNKHAAWPLLASPAQPLGNATVVKQAGNLTKTTLLNLGEATDDSVLKTYQEYFVDSELTAWPTTAAALLFLARLCELQQPVILGDLQVTAAKLANKPENIVALLRLAQAVGQDPSTVIFHGHPLTAWRWHTEAYCRFDAAQRSLAKLDALPGMPEVKRQLHETQQSLSFGLLAAAMGQLFARPVLHMEFSGSPGTGKTTVARIYAEMLQGLGLLRTSKVVEVGREDLVAQYEGHTAAKTRQVLDQARGGVLFIDEAYALISGDSDNFGREAVATLVKYMEDHRDDLVVVLAGYPQKMQQLYAANEGLHSRIGQRILFRDYDTPALLAVLQVMAKQSGYQLDAATCQQLRPLVDRQRGPGFANARSMRNLLDRAVAHHQAHHRSDDLAALAQGTTPVRRLSVADFDADLSAAEHTSAQQALQDLGALVGLEPVKHAIRALHSSLRTNRARQSLGMAVQQPPMHALFAGGPGTGKSTVARLYGRILAGTGLLPRGEVIETRPGDYIAGYLGQTETKTRRLLETALGSVLVIDDAHLFAEGQVGSADYGSVALQEILHFAQAYAGQVAVIFTGSPSGLAALYRKEPKLRGCIGLTLDFADYTADQLAAILRQQVARSGYRLAEDVDPGALIADCLAAHRHEPSQNAHNVEQVLQQARAQQDMRLATLLEAGAVDATALMTLQREDFAPASAQQPENEGSNQPGTLQQQPVGLKQIGAPQQPATLQPRALRQNSVSQQHWVLQRTRP
jgi:SpoVK/Ycf46/Vps4 family AAA+-type ATPase